MKPVLLGSLLFVLATAALAHRLDEYLQAARLSVSTNRIDLALDLTAGVTVVDQLLVVMDKDHDGQVSEEESGAYAQLVLKELRIALDEKALALRLVESSFPALHEIKGGLGAIRIKASTPIGHLPAGIHTLSLTNVHLPTISVYLVNALVPKDSAIKIIKQTRDELQRNYRLDFRVIPTPP